MTARRGVAAMSEKTRTDEDQAAYEGAANGNGNDNGGDAGHIPIVPEPYIFSDPSKRPPRQWLWFYIRGFGSGTIAPGGTGKTALCLIEFVSMVIGRDLLHGGNPIPKKVVWYINAEDPLEELERRLDAICLHYGVKAEELGGRFLLSGRETPVVLVKRIAGEIQKCCRYSLIYPTPSETIRSTQSYH
jgi:AAA domain